MKFFIVRGPWQLSLTLTTLEGYIPNIGKRLLVKSSKNPQNIQGGEY